MNRMLAFLASPSPCKFRSSTLALALALLSQTATPAFCQTTGGAPAPYQPPAATAEAPAVPSPPAARPSPDDMSRAAEALDPSVEDVQVVGPWTDGAATGVWRAVMLQVAGTDDRYRFFLQRLQKGTKGFQTISTLEILEIATIDGAVVGYRADEPTEGDESSLTLFFDVVPSKGEVTDTYELHVTKDAPYRFGPASN